MNQFVNAEPSSSSEKFVFLCVKQSPQYHYRKLSGKLLFLGWTTHGDEYVTINLNVQTPSLIEPKRT